MAKVVKQTAPAGADATKASPRSDILNTDLTAIYAIVGEFVCLTSQTEQIKDWNAKGRAQRAMEIAAEASERLDEFEARISLRPGPQILSEQSARSGCPVSDSPVSDKTSAAHESTREHRAEFVAIRTAHDLLTLQFGKVQPKDRVWVRIMDTVMGWCFVVALFVWTYVLRLFGPKRN